MEIISEGRFQLDIRTRLKALPSKFHCVTGPGRSGAIAAVYASHILSIPFIPYGAKCPDKFTNILIIDTATQSGRTLRRAIRHYGDERYVLTIAVYSEPPRVKFWYENHE